MKWLINAVVPIALAGMLTNVIPWIIVLIPLPDKDICWLYFLTRAPIVISNLKQGVYITG